MINELSHLRFSISYEEVTRYKHPVIASEEEGIENFAMVNLPSRLMTITMYGLLMTRILFMEWELLQWEQKHGNKDHQNLSEY